MQSISTIPPTPYCIGIGNDGGMVSAMCKSGKASALSTTEEYIAPEAPNDGRIFVAPSFVFDLVPATANAEAVLGLRA